MTPLSLGVPSCIILQHVLLPRHLFATIACLPKISTETLGPLIMTGGKPVLPAESVWSFRSRAEHYIFPLRSTNFNPVE